jgi:hypothetical protein
VGESSICFHERAGNSFFSRLFIFTVREEELKEKGAQKKESERERGEMRFIIKYSSFGENCAESFMEWWRINFAAFRFAPSRDPLVALPLSVASSSIFVCIKRTIFNLKIEFEMCSPADDEMVDFFPLRSFFFSYSHFGKSASQMDDLYV